MGRVEVTSRSVLLVDDTPSMRMITRIMLETEPGWVVIGEVEDGQAAVDFVQQTCPDVIVLDQQMPFLSGLDALPQLRASCPRARVVMWSSDPRAEHRALLAGVDAFVHKTAPMDELVAALRVSTTPGAAEQRTTDRAVAVRRPEHVVLTLPAHRIVPGAIVAWTTADGHPRRIVLPADVTAGVALPLESVGVDDHPRHLLLLSA